MGKIKDYLWKHSRIDLVVLPLAATLALIGVSLFAISEKRGLEINERSRLIAKVNQRLDSNNNGILEPNEIGQFYSVLGRLDYRDITKKDMELYLERTELNNGLR